MHARAIATHAHAREHGASCDVRSHRHLRLFEIALVFMCRDHVASVIVKADHGVM